MAIVHAIPDSIDTEIITHSHDDGIIESHVVDTTEHEEPPHCSETQIDTSITQQVRDASHGSDVFGWVSSLYYGYDQRVKSISHDIYLQHYPWSENHFFWHLLVGEKILLI